MAVAPRPPLATGNWLLADVGISSDLIYSQDDLYWLIVIPNRALNRVFRCAIDRKSHMGPIVSIGVVVSRSIAFTRSSFMLWMSSRTV